MANVMRGCDHLKDLVVPLPFNKKPAILIGLEHPKLGLATQIRKGRWNQPVASKTALGWVIHGKKKSDSPNNVSRSLFVGECKKEVDLHRQIDGCFSTENFGIRVVEQPAEVREIGGAKQIMKDTTKFEGRRYETDLLWRMDKVSFPDSRPMAMRRLMCPEKQMGKDWELARAMREKIKDSLGCIAKLSMEQVSVIGLRTWYAPLLAVKGRENSNLLRCIGGG
jgi:hypothetical protein